MEYEDWIITFHVKILPSRQQKVLRTPDYFKWFHQHVSQSRKNCKSVGCKLLNFSKEFLTLSPTKATWIFFYSTFFEGNFVENVLKLKGMLEKWKVSGWKNLLPRSGHAPWRLKSSTHLQNFHVYFLVSFVLLHHSEE